LLISDFSRRKPGGASESLMTNTSLIFQRADFQSSIRDQKSSIRWFVDIYIQSLGTRTLRLRFVLDLSFPITAVSRLHEKQQRIGKVKDQAERVISTPELNMLPCLHPEPINVVVYHDPSGRSHLGIGLALRCFQRLSFPNIATQHCS
jgi:hypothetical protein